MLLGLLVAVKKVGTLSNENGDGDGDAVLRENTFNFAGGRGGEWEVVVDVLNKPTQFFEIGNGHY